MLKSHRNKIDLEMTPDCDNSKVKETPSHFLLYCKIFDGEWQTNEHSILNFQLKQDYLQGNYGQVTTRIFVKRRPIKGNQNSHYQFNNCNQKRHLIMNFLNVQSRKIKKYIYLVILFQYTQIDSNIFNLYTQTTACKIIEWDS